MMTVPSGQSNDVWTKIPPAVILLPRMTMWTVCSWFVTFAAGGEFEHAADCER